jgi:hypothetical protein
MWLDGATSHPCCTLWSQLCQAHHLNHNWTLPLAHRLLLSLVNHCTIEVPKFLLMSCGEMTVLGLRLSRWTHTLTILSRTLSRRDSSLERFILSNTDR